MVNMVNQLKFSFLNFRSHDVQAALEFIGPHLAGILVSKIILCSLLQISCFFPQSQSTPIHFYTFTPEQVQRRDNSGKGEAAADWTKLH